MKIFSFKLCLCITLLGLSVTTTACFTIFLYHRAQAKGHCYSSALHFFTWPCCGTGDQKSLWYRTAHLDIVWGRTLLRAEGEWPRTLMLGLMHIMTTPWDTSGKSLPPANGPRGSDPPQQPGSSQATSQVPSPLQEMDRGEWGHWSCCPSPLSHFLLIYMQLRGSICMVWLLCGSYMNNLHPATGTESVATQQLLLQACLSALQEPVLLLTCFLLV